MDGFCTLVTTELSHVVVRAGQLAAAICSYNHVQNKQYLYFIYICPVSLLGQFWMLFFQYPRYQDFDRLQIYPTDYLLSQGRSTPKVSQYFICNFLSNPA